jgi:hypothetical protein
MSAVVTARQSRFRCHAGVGANIHSGQRKYAKTGRKKKMDKKTIMYDSPEAAKRVDGISGWVSSTGHFWGEDEHMARYDGSTHKRCECGEIIAKSSWCDKCYEKRAKEAYAKRDRQEWDGVTPLYSEVLDKYSFSEDAYEICDDRELSNETFEALRVMICVPQMPSQIDVDELYEDLLTEDGELPDDLADAFDELNEFIRQYKTPLSWYPGKYAAVLKAAL